MDSFRGLFFARPEEVPHGTIHRGGRNGPAAETPEGRLAMEIPRLFASRNGTVNSRPCFAYGRNLSDSCIGKARGMLRGLFCAVSENYLFFCTRIFANVPRNCHDRLSPVGQTIPKVLSTRSNENRNMPWLRGGRVPFDRASIEKRLWTLVFGLLNLGNSTAIQEQD